MFWFWPISRGQSIYIGDRERNVANHGDAKVGEEIRHPQSPPIYPCICESLMGGWHVGAKYGKGSRPIQNKWRFLSRGPMTKSLSKVEKWWRPNLDNANGEGFVLYKRKMCCRATSHTRLKAHDHCILKSLIGQKCWDCPSSLHTRKWRLKGSKTISWMTSLHGFLHGILWITFHGLPEISLSPPPRDWHDGNSNNTCQNQGSLTAGMAIRWESKVLVSTWSWSLADVWSVSYMSIFSN